MAKAKSTMKPQIDSTSCSIPSVSGVYAIINRINGKRYYGSAMNLRRRKNIHWHLLQNGRHTNVHLQRAWNKHGESSFQFVVVEFVSPALLLAVEQNYLDLNVNGYNIAPIANNRLDTVVTPKSRRRMSESHKGMRRSLESRLKQSATTRGRPGHIPSDATRAIWSAQRKGRTASERTKSKMSERLRQRWASIPRGPVTLVCDACKKEFSVSYRNRKRRHTCSDECANASRSQTKRRSPKWRRLTHNGLSLTVREWSERTGIPTITIHDRLWRGWSVSRAVTVKNGRDCPQRKTRVTAVAS